MSGLDMLMGLLDHTAHHRASAEMYLRAKGTELRRVAQAIRHRTAVAERTETAGYQRGLNFGLTAYPTVGNG